MLLRRAARRRKDFVGVEDADLELSRAPVLLDKHVLLRKSLQSLLSGSVVTQRIRYLSGKSESALCQFCQAADEDMFHLLWQCQSWQHIRCHLDSLALRPHAWPPAMQLCGYYVPAARHAPPPESWNHVQVTLARIIQARVQHLTSHGLFDTDAGVVEDDGEDDGDDADAGHHLGPSGTRPVKAPNVQVSEYFPMFRMFARDSLQGSLLDFKNFLPKFNCGDTGAFNWGKPVWHALQCYWSKATVHLDAAANPSFEHTPWVVVACDAVIAYGKQVFLRADGDNSILSLLRVFPAASRRYAQLCGCNLFENDGPDSKRLRTLWVPQVETLPVHVCLLNPCAVNDVMEQWGSFCLGLEVDASDSTVPWSAKAAWVPDFGKYWKLTRRRVSRKAPALIVSCLPDRQAHVSTSAPIELCPEGDVAWQAKLAAIQLKRRLHKLSAHNAEAVSKQTHVICADNLLERPRCAVCRANRRKEHWLRLAADKCKLNSGGPDITIAVSAQDAVIQRLLRDCDEKIAVKASRPCLTKALAARKAQRAVNRA